MAKSTKRNKWDDRTYEAVLGPNSKQWWRYDNDTNEYCDPPIEVLEEIKKHSKDVNEQEAYFNLILANKPSWLKDREYRYEAEEIDI